MKKEKNFKATADEIFDAVKRNRQIEPPKDLGGKIRQRVQGMVAKNTTIRPLKYLEYAAAIALLLLNITALYQLSLQNTSTAEKEYQTIFQEEYSLRSQSIFR